MHVSVGVTKLPPRLLRRPVAAPTTVKPAATTSPAHHDGKAGGHDIAVHAGRDRLGRLLRHQPCDDGPRRGEDPPPLQRLSLPLCLLLRLPVHGLPLSTWLVAPCRTVRCAMIAGAPARSVFGYGTAAGA